MADMHGAVRSNIFKVKDVDAFRAWFEEHVHFNDDVTLWTNIGDNKVSLGGYAMYPTAWPSMPVNLDDPENPDAHAEQWNLDAFAAEMRKHLQDGEEFRVLAVGNEKLRYTGAQHLHITHSTAVFTDLYEGN